MPTKLGPGYLINCIRKYCRAFCIILLIVNLTLLHVILLNLTSRNITPLQTQIEYGNESVRNVRLKNFTLVT